MKFSLFSSFAVAACALTVLCSTQVHAKKDVVEHVPCLADPGMEMMCDSSQNQLDQLFESVFAKIPHKIFKAHQNSGLTSAERRRKNAAALVRQQGLFSDIKEYFVNYWNNLKLIFQGRFGEGIFNQLKNSGSWCEKDNWIVKAIKAGINAISGGALSSICDCVYPVIKNHDNWQQLVAALETHGLFELLGKCTDNLKKHIEDALKKSDGAVKNGKKGEKKDSEQRS